MPSVRIQKTFIIDNNDILDIKSKQKILRIVINENNSNENNKIIIMKNSITGHVSVNLNNIDNENTINEIYIIVKDYLEFLRTPF